MLTITPLMQFEHPLNNRGYMPDNIGKVWLNSIKWQEKLRGHNDTEYPVKDAG